MYFTQVSICCSWKLKKLTIHQKHCFGPWPFLPGEPRAHFQGLGSLCLRGPRLGGPSALVHAGPPWWPQEPLFTGVQVGFGLVGWGPLVCMPGPSQCRMGEGKRMGRRGQARVRELWVASCKSRLGLASCYEDMSVRQGDRTHFHGLRTCSRARPPPFPCPGTRPGHPWVHS